MFVAVVNREPTSKLEYIPGDTADFSWFALAERPTAIPNVVQFDLGSVRPWTTPRDILKVAFDLTKCASLSDIEEFIQKNGPLGVFLSISNGKNSEHLNRYLRLIGQADQFDQGFARIHKVLLLWESILILEAKVYADGHRYESALQIVREACLELRGDWNTDQAQHYALSLLNRSGFRVADELTKHARETLLAQVDSESPEVRFSKEKIVGKSLLDQIWIQIRQEFLEGTHVARCCVCSQWFPLRGRLKSGTSPKKSCSKACKQKIFRQKRRAERALNGNPPRKYERRTKATE